MRCSICKRKFEIKRNFNNLLKIERYYICDSCYKKYPISLDMFTMPLSEGRTVYVYTLFSEDNRIDTTPFIKEFSFIYKYCMKKHTNTKIILEEQFKINDESMFYLNVLSSIEEKSVVIITDFIGMSS